MMEGYVGGELNGQVISFGRMKKKRNTSTVQQSDNSATLKHCNTSKLQHYIISRLQFSATRAHRRLFAGNLVVVVVY